MQSLITGILCSLGILLVPLFVTPQNASAKLEGAPAGFAGNYEDQPGEPRTCLVCHFEGNGGDGSVSIDVPGSVEPGDTVAISVTVSGLQENGRQGFELAVEDAEGDPFIGEFDLAGSTNIRYAAGADSTKHEVTHTEAGTALSTWTVNWIAPDDLDGDVTFYAAGNAANADEAPGGDYIYTTTAVLPVTIDAEDDPGEGMFSLSPVWPNPVRSAARATLVLDEPGMVTARLLDTRGRIIRVLDVGKMSRGAHELPIDARNLAAGNYVILVDAPRGVLHRILTVL